MKVVKVNKISQKRNETRSKIDQNARSRFIKATLKSICWGLQTGREREQLPLYYGAISLITTQKSEAMTLFLGPLTTISHHNGAKSFYQMERKVNNQPIKRVRAIQNLEEKDESRLRPLERLSCFEEFTLNSFLYSPCLAFFSWQKVIKYLIWKVFKLYLFTEK